MNPSSTPQHIAIGMTEIDPTRGLKAFASAEIDTWTEAEIAQFEAFWPVGSKPRLAFALHLYTGQRRSDVRMTWGGYDGELLRVAQQKTGTELAIAVHPDLAAILDAARRTGVAALLTEYGKPFSVAGYGKWMGEALRKPACRKGACSPACARLRHGASPRRAARPTRSGRSPATRP
jgi:enterobacteria phage integrase